jgi:hypothetical protein
LALRALPNRIARPRVSPASPDHRPPTAFPVVSARWAASGGKLMSKS